MGSELQPGCRVISIGLLLFLTWFSQIINGQDICVIGTSANSQYPYSSMNFFLNTRDPASCDGNITTLRYCYYSADSDAVLSSLFAVYRPNKLSDDSISYDIVSLQFEVTSNATSLNLSKDLEQTVCSNVRFEVPVAVQAGDVLGACLFSEPAVAQLQIVGNTTSTRDYLMLADVNTCASSSLPSNVSSLTQVNHLVLHLYAEITPSGAGIGASGIIGIIVSVLIVIVLTVTFVIVIWWICRKRMGLHKSSSSVQLYGGTPGFDNIGYNSYSGNSTMIQTVSPNSNDNDTNGLNNTSKDLSQNDNVVSPRPTGLRPPPEDSGQYDDVVMQREAWPHQSAVDSGDYDVVSSQRGAQRFVVSTNSCLDSGRDMGSANEAHERNQVLTSQEMCSSRRNIYEFEFSRSLNRSFECSYENVAHYEDKTQAGEDYLSPTDSNGITINRLLEMNKEEDIYSEVNPYQSPASKENDIYSQLESWGAAIIPVEDLEVNADLGSGEFGSVKQGVWTDIYNQTVHVALKVLKHDSSSRDRLMFLQEAAIMAQFRHPNVVMLHGVVTQTQAMMLVVELAQNGDLRNYLLSIRPSPGEIIAGKTTNILLQYSQQVALGMQYLSAKGFVHRDLAARNILLSKKNVCKVADFGLSRDLVDGNYYISKGQDKIPVKWTAPEALNYKKYSTASDVWAYGCLLYEIWSVGYKPFEGIGNLQTVKLIDSGNRSCPPPGCPRMIYELMMLCWHPETSLRPKFRDIVLTLVGSEKIVLNIPVKDSSTHPLAGVLGAPLEAGENMYTDLQKRYVL